MRAALALVAVALAAPAAAGPPPAREPAGWFDVRAFGAKGDGHTDDSRALQAALDAARMAGGGVVFLPAGTYAVAPPGASGRRPTLQSLTIGSNVWLRGDGPATVLKVKDGVGSYRALFSNHPTPAIAVENVVISDLRVDQNCAASGGDVRTGGDEGNHFTFYLAWAGRNITIERVRFDAICGVQTLMLVSTEGSNLVVRDSYFRFAKGPTTDPSGSYDNTAVYVHAKGTSVTGNVFESTAADGARGAIELHGSRGVAGNNVTRWYQSCVRVVGTNGKGEAPPRWQNGFTVTGNTCADAKDAINVWSITDHDVRGITIVGNTIGLAQIDHQAHTRHLRYFFGISFAWDSVSGQLNGDITDVVVEGNTITAQPSSGACGPDCAYSSGGISLVSAGNIANVLVRGNVIRDVPTKGIAVQSMGRGTRATNVRVEGNVLVNPGNDPAAGEHRAGIALGGRLEDIEVAYNSIVGTMVPFRGQFAVRAVGGSGSARVGIHDNVWTTADPRAAYQVSTNGEGIDAGVAGRTTSVTVSPRPGDIVAFGPSPARIWDVTVTGPSPFAIRAPPSATPGQRLTIFLRNATSGPLGAVRWDGFRLGAWTSPRAGHHRVLEVLWDGAAWSELFQSQDVPN